MSSGELFRLAAFAARPGGGNPAGVWLGDALPDRADMQRIAAEVGYSETAFIAPRHGATRQVRYYSPVAEVPFCGHATIASGVVLGRESGAGDYRLDTAAGVIPVAVRDDSGGFRVALESVTPRQRSIDGERLAAYLGILGWQADQLDPDMAPVFAFAGAWHLILAAAERATLNELDYDFERLRELMLADDLTTVALIWRAGAETVHARNPFPVGGVVEDPATGAAAAALGGYLRDAKHLSPPAAFTILQGEDMGRPSRLHVEVPAAGGIVVSGTADDIETE